MKNTNKIDPVVTSNDAHYSSKRSFSTGKSLIKKKILCSSTDLVVWGTNLPSLVGIGRHTKQERND